jgi:hypothetical protein
MKKTVVFLSAALVLLITFCFAQGGAYKDQIGKMVDKLAGLSSLVDSGSIDFSSYDKWYKEFKEVSGAFVKQFYQEHKFEKSYKMAEQGINSLAEAWSLFNQVKFSETQYKESITLDSVSDAHKWKEGALTQRKKATEAIERAIDSLKNAKDSI